MHGSVESDIEPASLRLLVSLACVIIWSFYGGYDVRIGPIAREPFLVCRGALNVQYPVSVGVGGAYCAAQFEGELVLFCAGASWHVLTVGQADELGDESEALRIVEGGGALVSVERQSDALG